MPFVFQKPPPIFLRISNCFQEVNECEAPVFDLNPPPLCSSRGNISQSSLVLSNLCEQISKSKVSDSSNRKARALYMIFNLAEIDYLIVSIVIILIIMTMS